MDSQPRNTTKSQGDFENTAEAELLADEALEAKDALDHVQFEFVNLVPGRVARSHAMKMYWRQKKGGRERQEKKWNENQRPILPLLPKEITEARPRVPEELQSQEVALGENENSTQNMQNTPSKDLSYQLWEGLQFPFFDILCREKNGCSYKITVLHRKLFYHWLAMHADEIHLHLETDSFSPFRDIWIPLDLSNPASFNGIMAHAAAHLSRIQLKEASQDTLELKTDAIALVNKWLSDPTTALNDEVFAAVLRLFTFERYWGTSERSNLHKNGLRQMVEARGGYKTFETNWKLQLALSVVYLTPDSSWWGFPVKALNDFFCDALSLPYPLQSIQSSRIKDMDSPDLRYLRTAISLLRQKCSEKKPHDEDTHPEYGPALSILATIIFICVAITEGEHEDGIFTWHIDLPSLECLLFTSYKIWVDSEGKLSELIWDQFADRKENLQLKTRILTLTGYFYGINPLALHGLELCLLDRIILWIN